MQERSKKFNLNIGIWLALALLTEMLVIYYKFFMGKRSPNWTKILLFINSLIINDLSLRKYEGKISKTQMFWLLLGQKFIGISMTKFLLFLELPSITDSTLIFFLSLHFTTFVYLQSSWGAEALESWRECPARQVLQETFKGLGKAQKLFWLVQKGVATQTNPLCFVAVLIVRGTASSLYKEFVLKQILRKKMKMRKARKNLVYISVPSILTYLIYLKVVSISPD
mmetsp:Transcript_41282/g.39753  ORF Transcript_41282/g.39753 Transcript_41282/m.39753 type:complete len:225 (+) Transcript_41282:4-678(+)